MSRTMAYPAAMKRLALILFLALWPLPACAADFAAKVVGVSDGDTLTVLTPEKRRVKVRLHGIDSPETGQDFGTRAKQAASELAFGKQVTVREVDRDRYGRTVAEVILPDGRSLNREMVRAGMAWRYVKYAPNDRDLAGIEAEAKVAKRGLWSQPGAVPPWDWRHLKVAGDGQVIGNRRSHLYHAPNCRGAVATSEKNRVLFKTAAEAEGAGYRKAGDCR